MKVTIAGYEIEWKSQTIDQPAVVTVLDLLGQVRSWHKLSPADARGLAAVLVDAAAMSEGKT